MFCRRIRLLVFTSLMLVTVEAASATVTGVVTIKQIRTGWDADAFAVETNEPVMKPAGCPYPDGYGSSAASPGYKEHYAAVLTAFGTGRSIRIVVSDADCYEGRPRIMGLFLA